MQTVWKYVSCAQVCKQNASMLAHKSYATIRCLINKSGYWKWFFSTLLCCMKAVWWTEMTYNTQRSWVSGRGNFLRTRTSGPGSQDLGCSSRTGWLLAVHFRFKEFAELAPASAKVQRQVKRVCQLTWFPNFSRCISLSQWFHIS